MATLSNTRKTGLLKASQTQLTQSSLQTGTGASQSIAQSLGYAPTTAIVSKVTEPKAGNAAYAIGTHNTTHLQISAYSDMTYYVYYF